MADYMDLEQQRQAEALERQIQAVITKPSLASAFFCEDCDEAIPELRRAKLIGVTRCVGCQEIIELNQKHRRSTQ